MLQYFDNRHIYMLDGQRIPCVSDLCRFLSREVYHDAPTWKMEAAAERGTRVHEATVLLESSGSVEIDAEYRPYLSAYAAFLREHEVSWELTEHPDYHPDFGYAGTLDRYGTVDGIPTLVDIKTTYTVQKVLCEASLNLYRMILEARGRTVERLLILHLKKDGSYRLVPIPVSSALPNALLTLHNATRKKRRKQNVRRTETTQ